MSHEAAPPYAVGNNVQRVPGQATPATHRWVRYLPVVALTVLSVLIAAERLWSYHKPIGRDVSIYAVMGHELLAGRPLYSDLLEQRPPATMVSFAVAEFIVGHGRHAIYWLNVAVAVITLLGVYYAGATGGGTAGGLWAAALWVVVSGSFGLEGGEPNTEVFINACLIWAFALFLRTKETPQWLGRALVVGALFALASFYKHIAVVYPMLLAVAHVAFPPEGSIRRRALAQVLVIAVVGVLAWGGLFGYFAATGRFQIFRDMMIGFNLSYAAGKGASPATERADAGSVLLKNILAPLRREAELFPDMLKPLVLLTAVGALYGIWWQSRRWALLFAYAAASWIAIALPGQFFGHYYQLWLPPLAVGAGWAIALIRQVPVNILRPWLLHAVGAIALALLLNSQLPYYRMNAAGDWTPIEGGETLTAKPLAHEINSLLAPHEVFYEWGANPSLYFWSKRRPPTGVFIITPLLVGPLTTQLSERVLADLKRAAPELLVITKRTWPAEPDANAVTAWLAEHYRPSPALPDRGPYALYVRHGGSLEARLQGNTAWFYIEVPVRPSWRARLELPTLGL